MSNLETFLFIATDLLFVTKDAILIGFLLVDCDFYLQLVSQELAQDCVESVLKEIKRRVKARIELRAEIRQLESGNLPILISTTDPIPQKISTSLHRFTTLTWRSYSNYAVTPAFFEQGLVSSLDIFYEAVLRRGSSTMIPYLKFSRRTIVICAWTYF